MQKCGYKIIERNYLEDLNKIFNEFVEYYKDMDENLAIYTKALNIGKIDLAFDINNTKTKDRDIVVALEKVKNNRDYIKGFIAELENSKDKCLYLLKDSLYSENREEYNRHRKNLK